MKYIKKPIVIEAVQWNKPDQNGKPKLAKDCTDHEKVFPTSYDEVSSILETSGCSKWHPFWDWSVLGVIETVDGKQVVSPGDWIIKGGLGEFYSCKQDIFEETYEAVKV